MKILLVNKYWYPRGGAEVVAMMTKELLEKAGHTTAVFSMQHPKNTVSHKFFPPEIDYRKDSLLKKIKNSFKTISNTEAKKLFEKMVQEFQPDVVHFHNIYHQLSFSLLEITKKYQIRSVMTLHDYKWISPNYALFHHNNVDTSMLGKKYYRCLLNNCMESFPESIVATVEAYYRQWKKYQEMIDVYISPSEFLKNLFVQAGWNKEKIEVIHNPVQISGTSTKFHLPTKHDPVTYIGRLSKEKGVEVLLEAALKTPHIPYAIVGTGPLELHLRSLAISKGLKNVTFYGWKTGAELESLYESARLLVLPAVWYENAPLSIVEAKMHKKIILGSNIGGIPEMLEPEFLFEPGNSQELASKIEKYYALSLVEREKKGEAFKKEAEKEYSSDIYVKKIEAVYRGE